MKNPMEYKSYKGIVEYSADDGVFFGKIFGVNDLITFEGDTVKELEVAFRGAVDDYLQACNCRKRARAKFL
ncbi:type II toxin-antitoxin system HicB family antitoxin [Ohtaekwangia sp.]|uniref:type II toxin-antitoxin system HicB family antitoxin n=1 Tax=Ohtaekwangia sp. TaxID=2066019 RepID=UPI002FDD1459